MLLVLDLGLFAASATMFLALLWQIFNCQGFEAVRALCWRGLRECEECCWRMARMWWRSCDSFPPFRRFEGLGLEEGEGDHRHQAMPVQPCP
jgi:hypothetical protein